MARSVTGVYTLPQLPFTDGTVILSSVMNSDLSDIASALTSSLATDGVAFMTAPLYGYAGIPSNPGYTFDTNSGVGFYLSSGALKIAMSSTSIGSFAASATLSWYYKHFFAQNVSFLAGAFITGGINASVTITGDAIILGGLCVGYSGTPIADRVQLADDNYYIDFTLGVMSFDSNDYIQYVRATNIFTYNSGGLTLNQIQNGIALYKNHITLKEITAPASAPANSVYIYAKDNSGTTRVVYKDEQGVETFMGGPGQWEQIGQTKITSSVAGVSFSFTKRYSRLVLAAQGILSNAAVNMLVANLSDDGGTTLVSCRGACAEVAGNITVTAQAAFVELGAANDDSCGRIEYNRMDKTGPKSYTAIGANNTNDDGFYSAGMTASCGPANYIVLSNGDLSNISPGGCVTLFGLLAR